MRWAKLLHASPVRAAEEAEEQIARPRALFRLRSIASVAEARDAPPDVEERNDEGPFGASDAHVAH